METPLLIAWTLKNVAQEMFTNQACVLSWLPYLLLSLIYNLGDKLNRPGQARPGRNGMVLRVGKIWFERIPSLWTSSLIEILKFLTWEEGSMLKACLENRWSKNHPCVNQSLAMSDLTSHGQHSQFWAVPLHNISSNWVSLDRI
jgi:hypothetical protein